MVTERSGDCSARRKQARLTNASECSSWQGWATPMSGTKDHMSSSVEYYQRRQRIGKQVDLNGQVILDNWATPNTMDHLQAGISGSFKESLTGRRKRSSNLREQVNPNWPTASASDTEGGSQADRVEWTEKGATLRKKNKPHMTYGAKLRDAVENHENWPTPRAGNPGSRKPGTGGKILAEEAKKNWATPTTQEAKNVPYHGKKGERPNDLTLLGQAQVEILAGPPAQEKSSTSGKNHGSWPTPRVGGNEKAETSIKRGRGVSLTGAVAKDATQTPKLNPSWVEQLMGLSTGWTDLGSWAMELSPKQQN